MVLKDLQLCIFSVLILGSFLLSPECQSLAPARFNWIPSPKSRLTHSQHSIAKDKRKKTNFVLSMLDRIYGISKQFADGPFFSYCSPSVQMSGWKTGKWIFHINGLALIAIYHFASVGVGSNRNNFQWKFMKIPSEHNRNAWKDEVIKTDLALNGKILLTPM